MTAGLARLRPSWVRRIEVKQVQDFVPGECWLWTGANSAGYGCVTVNKKPHRLHRYVYELLVGPIPNGLHIDHLCRQPPCCNPEHLEPVTPLVNTRRGIGHGSETHCPKGHAYEGDNLYLAPHPKGYRRVCRQCRDKYMAEWKAARKERQRQTWAMYLSEAVA